MSSALFSSEASPDSQTWSAAVGPATTSGRSGRMIERLQGEIDRLNRDKKLLKSRFDEAEKANETLASQNQYLSDRQSNYDQTHDTSQRQLARKERQLEEMREELRREKAKTERAEETARIAVANEESWRDQASQAKSLAAQKEAEYETIIACRNRDNDQHQGKLHKIKDNLEVLIQQRTEDQDTQRKLELLAEQQRQNIDQLEEHTKRLNSNFKAYRTEIDRAIAEMRQHVTSNDSEVSRRLMEMTRVTGEMRWVMNIEQEFNQRPKTAGEVQQEREGESGPLQRPLTSGKAGQERQSEPAQRPLSFVKAKKEAQKQLSPSKTKKVKR